MAARILTIPIGELTTVRVRHPKDGTTIEMPTAQAASWAQSIADGGRLDDLSHEQISYFTALASFASRLDELQQTLPDAIDFAVPDQRD